MNPLTILLQSITLLEQELGLCLNILNIKHSSELEISLQDASLRSLQRQNQSWWHDCPAITWINSFQDKSIALGLLSYLLM